MLVVFWKSAVRKMTVGLAVLGLVNAITIDNHLLTTKSDCYERLAIGQRLDSRDVSKTISLSTVADCQKECSIEDHRCLSFSFGIDPKGNGTCELSYATIKETADLRPIGTISNPDFDLYIKKVDCKLNIPKDPPSSPSLLTPDQPTHSHESPKPISPPPIIQKPDDLHRPTYLVAILDPKGSNRPAESHNKPSEGYDVKDPYSDYYKPSYQPTKRPNSNRPHESPGDRYDYYDRPSYLHSDDEFTFYPDRKHTSGSYQNYYNVDRPYPYKPYGSDKDKNQLYRPVLPYPEEHYTYGKPNTRPGTHGQDFDKYSSYQYGQSRPNYDIPYRPSYEDSYNVDKPENDRYKPHYPSPASPINSYENNRPAISIEIDKTRPYRPEYDNYNNPNNYDNTNDYNNNKRPIPDRPYGPESDINRPNYVDYVPDKRPISENIPNRYPTADRPYRPESDIPNIPYGPEPSNIPNQHFDRPYGPEPDRPYIPVSENIPERFPSANRPYRPESGIPNSPYGPESNEYPVYDRPDIHRPYIPVSENIPDKYANVNRPYRPQSDIPSRPYEPEQDYIPNKYHVPDRPYELEPNRYFNKPYGPEPDNPNSYDRKPTIDRYDVDKNNPYDDARNSNRRPISNKPNSDRGQSRPYLERPKYDNRKPDYNNRPEINNRPDFNRKPDYDRRPQTDFDRKPDYDRRPDNNRRPGYDKRPEYDYDRRPVGPDSTNNPNYQDNRKPYDPNWDRLVDSQHSGRPSNYGNHQDSNLTLRPTVSENSSVIPNKTEIQSTSNGGTVTSVITQIIEPCYRRALAGKRVGRNFIKRTVPCERVEDCQRECQDEKRFVCEGFNYRLDPSGHGQGDCELTDLPLSRMSLERDVIPDRDYDFYEKDRNSGPDCRPLIGYRPGGPGPGHGPGPGPRPIPGNRYPPSAGHWYGHDGIGYPPHTGSGWPSRPGDRYPIAPPRPPGGNRYPPPGYRPPYGEGRKDIGPTIFRCYPICHHQTDHYDHRQSPGYHYPIRPQDPYQDDWRRYDHSRPLLHYPQLPPPRRIDIPIPTYHQRIPESYYHERERDRMHWGFKHHDSRWGSYGGTYGNFGGPDSYYGDRRNQNRLDIDRRHFVPYRIGQVGGPRDWGRYGGSYGTGGGYYSGGRYDYWGFNKYPAEMPGDRRYYFEPPRPSGFDGIPYLPGDDYRHRPRPPPPALPPSPPGHFDHTGYDHHHGHPGHINHIGFDDYHHQKGDDCSSRRGMGFRLHKAIVKKYYAVPNIHECERLCYTEKDFICVSFSYRNFTYPDYPDFDWTYENLDETLYETNVNWTIEERIINKGNNNRYSITLSSPSDNCYLSDRPYKDLDFYTDLEPDRDFDIYTMHKTDSCLIPPPIQEESECFLRVRSGQRLDHAVVKDTMNVKSMVDCQLECLTSKRFTCRSFCYRYGPPLPGGAVDNCLLSDWPYLELDPLKDLASEPGYEVYERGSYGHGCEHDHFSVSGHHGIGDGTGVVKQSDKICYVGYAKPARLSHEATRGALSVSNELDCKTECTRAREETAFPCMSFSFRSLVPKGEPNCELSDIEQRDLLPEVDYLRDPESWLFAWDNYNPTCAALATDVHHTSGHDHNEHHGRGPYDVLDTWRVYSVNGWPCRQGTTCQENREAGFWSCELEGGEVGSWDYCCRPDHQCGYSQGYSYPWCYVGPSRDQWRKCSDQYYPYSHNKIPSDKHDIYGHKPPNFGKPYLPRPPSRPTWYADRPYRPPYGNNAPGLSHRPSLDEYENKFNQQFLDPPKPGGFGPARHWPVSYLHKEQPPNSTTEETDRQDRKMSKDNQNYKAINSLVDTIKSNDLKNTRYQITNQSNNADDVLFVRIPMPEDKSKDNTHDKILKFDVVDMKPEQVKNEKKGDNFEDLFLISKPKDNNKTDNSLNRTPKRELQMFPVVRKGYVTRTNRTARRRRIRPDKDTVDFYN